MKELIVPHRNEQVCCFEDAKKLKEIGIPQIGYFSWFGEESQRLIDNGKNGVAVSNWLFVATTEPINNQEADHRDDCCLKPIASAFTSTEIGAMLPDGYATERKNGKYFCGTDKLCVESSCEVSARVEMLIYCIKNGIIKLTD